MQPPAKNLLVLQLLYSRRRHASGFAAEALLLAS